MHSHIEITEHHMPCSVNTHIHSMSTLKRLPRRYFWDNVEMSEEEVKQEVFTRVLVGLCKMFNINARVAYEKIEKYESMFGDFSNCIHSMNEIIHLNFIVGEPRDIDYENSILDDFTDY